jgi:ATP-binding cassette subfamily F protein 3
MEYGYNVKVGYYDQENQDLNGQNTAMDELWSMNETLSPGEIRGILAHFLFTGDACFKVVKTLSGGERARLTFAKMLMSKSNLLILDEPTNHLDIDSREALENALIEFEGTIIAVSHDRYFIDKLSTRMLVFGIEKDGSLFDFKGKYTEFINYKERFLIAQGEQKNKVDTATDAKTEFLNNKAKQAEKRKQIAKIERSKKECSDIESRLSEIDVECENASTDHKKLAVLYDEKENLEMRLLELYEFLDTNSVEL